MPFDHRSKSEIFKVPNLAPVGPHVFFNDVLGTTDQKLPNPVTGSWFRIEQGPEAPPPKYEYDEVGVVVDGEITLKDETGQQRTLHAGDTFVVHRGSTIAFSSATYGIAWKCSGRAKAKL